MPGGWVLLNYRMPRVPSSPRVAVWRRLQALGVAQLGDGLVALPADARTKEHFEWIAAEIEANGGAAAVWVGRPSSPVKERGIVRGMQEERRNEYLAVVHEAAKAAALGDPTRSRTAKRLQQQHRKISRRDYFPPEEKVLARTAIKALLRPQDSMVPAVAADEAGR